MIQIIDNPETDQREFWKGGELVDTMSRRYIEESNQEGRARLKWGYYPQSKAEDIETNRINP